MKQAKVLLVGAGGLGSVIALYLTAVGIGRIGIVDDDTVELSNLNRQVIHSTTKIGMPKVDSANERLRALNPNVHIEAIQEHFQAKNALQISADYDILVDGTDNLSTRYLLNDTAFFTGKPYIYGAVHEFEGQVSVFDSRHGPCYRCVFPAMPPSEDNPPLPRLGVFGSLPATIGSLQVLETVKIITGIGTPLYGRLFVWDGLSAAAQTIRIRKNTNCLLCGDHASIHQLQDQPESAYRTSAIIPEITPLELNQKMRDKENFLLVDVRQPVERQICQLPGSLSLPSDTILEHLSELDPTREMILYCRTSRHSTWAAHQLIKAGFHKVWVLKGGINAWSREIDPSMPIY